MSERTASGVRHQASRMPLLLVALLFVGACDGDDGAPDTGMGEWVLVTVEGEPLPVLISEGEQDTTFIVGGKLNLGARNEYSDTVDFEIRNDAGVESARMAFGGHWSRDGDDVHVVSQFDESITMNLTIDDGRLVNPETNWGVVVYERSDDE